VLENKQFREIADSALIMISMTYAPGGETIHFVGEIFASLSPVLAASRCETKWEGRGPRAQGASDRGPLSARCEGQKPPVRESRRSAHRDPLESAARQKLRKRAAKPMKSLVRVNLCATGLPMVSTSLGGSR
jgi:hypothetical protein